MTQRKSRLEALALRMLALDPRTERDEEGQSMVEYALILMIISITVILIIGVIGKQTSNMFSNVTNGFNQ